jgi:hypothetical protein
VRRYAEDTRVAIGRTRDQIARLLQEWSCEEIGWLDRYKDNQAVLQFVVARLGADRQAHTYRVQFTITVESEESIKKRCTGSRGLAVQRYQAEMARRGAREHRVLYLWLKAAMEAVAEKIVPFEAVFLPYFMGTDGRTVADVLIPNLPRLTSSPANRLLSGGPA